MRDGILEQNENSKFLKFSYKTVLGRALMKIFISPTISKIVGFYMNSKFSKKMIQKFINKNKIDISEYETKNYKCFNDFFTRKVKPSCRPIDTNNNSFISPCDAKLSAYKIDEYSTFIIKNSIYTVSEIIDNPYLAKKYQNGYCLIFRLCVDNYHRYCYIDDGTKTDNFHINGELHTVRPIATNKYKVYSRNAREYTILNTDNFGPVIQVEVGAICIGKIKNFDKVAQIKKGKEKGMFEYGGSTIVLLVEEGRIRIDEDIIENSNNGLETVVKMGEKIGRI